MSNPLKSGLFKFSKQILFKYLLAFCVLCLLLLILVIFKFSGKNVSISASEKVNNDSTAITKLYEKADKLRGSKPDSSLLLCNKAIELIKVSSGKEKLSSKLGALYILKASIHCNLGKYPESRVCDSLALSIAKQTNDKSIEAQAINITGLLYFNQGVYDSAMICYDKALKLANEINNKQLQAKLYTNNAIIDYYQGDCNKAIANFKKTLLIGEELNDSALISGSYINQGVVYQNFSEYDKAIEAFNHAIEIYEKINGTDGILMCYGNIGSIYYNESQYYLAIETFRKALELSEDIDDRYNIALSHHNIAEVYAHIGDYQEALNEYLLSIKIKEKLSDKLNLAKGYTGIGNLHYQNKNYEKALSYYQKSLHIDEALKYVKGIASDYSNIANIYCARNNYDSAFSFYSKALQINERIGNKVGISDAYLALGSVYRTKSIFDSANFYLHKALEEKIMLRDKEGAAGIYYELCLLNLQDCKKSYQPGKNLAAINYGIKAYTIAEEIHALPLLNGVSLSLKEAFTRSGDFQKALVYAEKYRITGDSLFDKNKTEALAFAEARWNAEKKQQQIDNLENQRKLDVSLIKQKNVENQRQKAIIVIVFLILVLAVSIAIIVIQYIKKKRDEVYKKQLSSIAALKMQNAKNIVSPHFLFNILNTVTYPEIQSLSHQKKLQNVSLMLRKVLENVDRTAVPLSEELSFVKAFVDLQRDKIPGSFQFDCNINNDVDTSVEVPAMIIQIPVENAIKHGLMPLNEAPKLLDLNITKSDEALIVEIIDNGIGFSPKGSPTTKGTGTGLKVLLQTIHLLNSKNKNQIYFSISSNTDNNKKEPGTKVEINVPFGYIYNN